MRVRTFTLYWQGELHVRQHPHDKPKSCMLFLFNDLLLVTERSMASDKYVCKRQARRTLHCTLYTERRMACRKYECFLYFILYTLHGLPQVRVQAVV